MWFLHSAGLRAGRAVKRRNAAGPVSPGAALISAVTVLVVYVAPRRAFPSYCLCITAENLREQIKRRVEQSGQARRPHKA